MTNALDRLSGVRIKASNSFYDNDSKAFNTRNFGIIDEYEINSGKMQNPKPSFFVWSEVLHKSFRSGFIKKLDFDFFLSLESAVSKRLYRFLDKHFWYRATFSMNLFTLAHEKIGVSRTYRYPSSLRQQIDPAVEELIQRGFLSNVEYTGQGKGTEITFYAAGENGRRSERRGSSSRTAASVSTSRDGRAREEARKTRDLAAKSSVSSEKGSPVTGSSVRGDYDVCEGLEEKLLARGISEPQASRLATLLSGERDSARAEEVVRFFDDLVQKKSHLISRNAPGFLYRALEDPWKFVLPTDSEQQVEPSRSELKTKARQRSVQKSNPKRRSGGGDAESRYLTFRKREIGRLTGQLEPSLQQGLEQEVRTALENIRSLVSEAGFAEAVKHGVEEKVAKLFAVPTYEEWLRSGGE
ncbi:replication initiator protein A [bacterium]|nr:replication initiator protein A [bacterium]